MGLPVVVNDPAVAYRRGLEAALREAGYETEECTDPITWAALPGRRALLWTTRTDSDREVLASLRSLSDDLVLVALLVAATPGAYVEALRCGADAAVAWEAAPERIVRVLSAAVERDVLLPAAVVRQLAASVPPLVDPEWINKEELSWLRSLAVGTTMRDLATQVGYSERELYRMLQSLYRRMGVTNRTQALLEASRWNLLGLQPAPRP